MWPLYKNDSDPPIYVSIFLLCLGLILIGGLLYVIYRSWKKNTENQALHNNDYSLYMIPEEI